MNRIIVNGEDLDLYPEDNINLNIKVNDISDISTRNSTYSNTIKIPATSNNKRIFNYLGIIGNTSRKQYEKVKCKYISNNLPLINNGYLQITETTSKEFSIVLFDGIIDLSEKIGGLNLSDLRSIILLNHSRNSSSVVASLSTNEGFIYPFANYVKDKLFIPNVIEDRAKITASELMPMLFVKTVLIAIIEEAGYTYSGDIFTNEEFEEEVFSMAEGLVGSNIDFARCLPKISQVDFLKDVLNRYGLIIRLEENNIEFAYLEDVLVGKYGIVDWTYKLNEIKFEKYNTNYTQKNIYTFNYSDSNNTDGDGILYVKNETLDNTKTLYKSIFDFNSDNILYSLADFTQSFNVPLFEYKEEEGIQVLKPKKTNSCLFKLDKSGKDFEIRNTTSSGDTYTVVNNLDTIPTTSGCTWSEYLNDKYVRLQNVLNDYKTISVDVNLTTIDVHNLDLFKIYYLSQTGQYYYLNNVKTNGLKSTAELTQINDIFEDNDFVDIPDAASIIITNVNPYYITPPSGFSQGFTTDYEFIGYQPVQAYIKIIKLDGEGGSPTGFEFTDVVNTTNTIYNYIIQYSQNDYCGWYSVQVFDPLTNLYSNIEEVNFVCAEPPEPTPSINITIEGSTGVDNGVPIYRDVDYKFSNFTPTSGTLIIQGKNYGTNSNIGSPTTITLTELSAGVTHILEDVSMNIGTGYYNIKLITNTITEEFNTFIF